MNYQLHYDSLVSRAIAEARKRGTIDYESHHILPKCMGGSNLFANLVLLTPEEHYVAHQLLVKIYPGNKSLIYAARMMCVGSNRSNKLYGWLKRKAIQAIKEDTDRGSRISKTLTGRIVPPEVGRKISESNMGRVVSDSTRQKLSAAGQGRPHSTEHRKALSRSHKNIPHTAEQHKKVIESKRKNGTLNHSQETKDKMSKTLSMLKWYNNGIRNIRISTIPPMGFAPGRVKWPVL